MKNNIRKLFQRAIVYWPKEFNVEEKKLHENGGATIPNLTKVHDTVEDEMLSANEDNDLMQMDWAIYTVLHQLARNVDLIRPIEVDTRKVEEVYVVNSRGD